MKKKHLVFISFLFIVFLSSCTSDEVFEEQANTQVEDTFATGGNSSGEIDDEKD